MGSASKPKIELQMGSASNSKIELFFCGDLEITGGSGSLDQDEMYLIESVLSNQSINHLTPNFSISPLNRESQPAQSMGVFSHFWLLRRTLTQWVYRKQKKPQNLVLFLTNPTTSKQNPADPPSLTSAHFFFFMLRPFGL